MQRKTHIDMRIKRNREEADRLADLAARLPKPVMAKAEARDATKKRKAS